MKNRHSIEQIIRLLREVEKSGVLTNPIPNGSTLMVMGSQALLLGLICSALFWLLQRQTTTRICRLTKSVRRIAGCWMSDHASSGDKCNSPISEIEALEGLVTKMARRLQAVVSTAANHENAPSPSEVRIERAETLASIGTIKTSLDVALSQIDSCHYAEASLANRRCYSDASALDRQIMSKVCMSAIEGNLLAGTREW